MKIKSRLIIGILMFTMITAMFSGTGAGNVIAAASEVNESEGSTETVDDFENGKVSNWTWGGGWKYDEKVELSAVTFQNENVLQLSLDYSPYSAESWSEAKISKNYAPALNISGYNFLIMDVYYPTDWDVTKLGVKFFSNSGLDQDVVIEDSVDAGGGYMKGTATVRISSCKSQVADLTIGIVGKYADFAGFVYLDNIRLAETSGADVSVAITQTAGTGTLADLNGMERNMEVVDPNAIEKTKELYGYLQVLSRNDQVLFGHQNDYHKKVSQSASEGDTKELTGSLSGIYGVDSLALTGVELGITNADEAMNAVITYSKAAADQGAIVTLSTHMPNFTNEKVKASGDGSYDFTACDFSESKDLSNDCAEQVLPGGAYNPQLNAYLDMIAEYALALQEDAIPLIFRPYHENNGSWFWWGSNIEVETYQALYQYTVTYLEEKGVHNILYVYSPNGPFTDAESYLERYPGDDYVDILAFDYYDDYNTFPASADGTFFSELETTCQVLSQIAEEKGKVAAISETGVRVMKEDGSDNEGLLPAGNPVTEKVTGINWYQKVCEIADEAGMPYFLVWANFGDRNFYVPYKVSDTNGHEMADDFIAFYNDDRSIFANGTGFYTPAEEIEPDITEELSAEEVSDTQDDHRPEESQGTRTWVMIGICSTIILLLIITIFGIVKNTKKKE